MRVPFGSQSQAARLPVRLGCESLLLSVDIDASGVDFIEALLLEIIEAFIVLIERGDPGALGLRGTKGHQPENHSRLGILYNERHGDRRCVEESWRSNGESGAAEDSDN